MVVGHCTINKTYIQNTINVETWCRKKYQHLSQIEDTLPPLFLYYLCHCQWLFSLTTFQCNAGKLSISIYALTIYENIRCMYLYTCTCINVQVTVIILLVITCLNSIFSTCIFSWKNGIQHCTHGPIRQFEFCNFSMVLENIFLKIHVLHL